MEFKYNSEPLNDGHYFYNGTGALMNDYHKRICMIKYNYLTLPKSVQFRKGDRIEYVYDAAGVKRQEVHKVANRNMNLGYFDDRDPTSSDINSSLTVATFYFGNKVYVNGQLKYILTEEGYIEKSGTTFTAYYYLNDHLGNHRIVIDASGTVKQVNNYYPSGTSMAERRTDQGVQPYKLGGKELDRTNNLDFYDFDARSYDPVLMRFTRPDPMAEKYYSVSPYAYCANNPVNAVDPTGMIWDSTSVAEVNNLKTSLNDQIKHLNDQIENYSEDIESGDLYGDEIIEHIDEISAFGERVSNIGKSINDIDKLGDDQRHTYVLNSNGSTTDGYVAKGRDGKISIVGNGGSLTVHEITHVRQSLDAGRLDFNSNKKLQYISLNITIQANQEVEAYQRQFSIKRTDLSTGLNLRNPNEITPQVVGKMRWPNGTFKYPAIHNRYFRNQ